MALLARGDTLLPGDTPGPDGPEPPGAGLRPAEFAAVYGQED
jgi:hypothetical protein